MTEPFISRGFRGRRKPGSIADRLPPEASEEDWVLLRPNVERLTDFAPWFDVLHGEVEAPELAHDERLLVRDAASVAEGLDWNADTWWMLTTELKASSGRKGPAWSISTVFWCSGAEMSRRWAPARAARGPADGPA